MKAKWYAVARWEFLEKVKTKSFFIGLLMMPLMIGLFMILPQLLAEKPDEKSRHVGIIDLTGVLKDSVSSRLARKYHLPNGLPNYDLVPIIDVEISPDHLKKLGNAKILANEIEGYFIIPADILSAEQQTEIEYRSENVSNLRDQERFSRALEDLIIERRLTRAGLDVTTVRHLTAKIGVKTIKVSKEGQEKESGFLESFMSGYIVILMLMFLVLTTGQMLVRSVVEEKSNRIVEVLVSSCSSKDLMVGKVLGLSLLGVTMVLFWLVIFISASLAVSMPPVSIDHLLLMLVYALLGYLLYAAIFVAIGAPLSTEQEAQQATSYISIVLVFPLALVVMVMQNPDSTIVKVLSLIPLLTPSFMAFRIPIRMPELWEIATSIVLLLASIVGMMWVASKIFRIGILITGKRPSFKEIVRWITTDV